MAPTLVRLVIVVALLAAVSVARVFSEQTEGEVGSRGFGLPPVPPPAMYQLTIHVSGDGNGSVPLPPAVLCPPACTRQYPVGTPIVLAPVPSPGSVFAGWAGDCQGNGPCTLTMTGSRTIEVKFTKLPVPGATGPSQWSTWSQAAAAAARQEAVKWLAGSYVDGAMCKVTGAITTAPGGVLKSRYAFAGLVRSALVQAGAPVTIAQNWDLAFKSAWDIWATHTTIPGLPWYPALGAWPGAVAPPTANTPSPLSTLVSGGIAAMSPGSLATAIQTKVGSQATSPGAAAAINGFANELAARFAQCQATCQVLNVMATGKVPNYAPPGCLLVR